jgi:tetratricopeptide (TPR) repeat protein
MYWSENNLGRARIHLDVALHAMKEKIDEVSEEYIGIMGNEGNLLTAEGKTDAALAAFSKAEQYRKQHNHPQNLGQAFLHLGIGRLELQKENFEEAEKRFLKASEIVVEHHGSDGPYMQEYVILWSPFMS